MDALKPKTSTGWDGLSVKLVKSIKTDIVKPLTFIINQMLETGIFPDKLKVAKVMPLFKKGDDTVFANYRPISLLPALSIIFEKVIYKQLYEYFQSKRLFYKGQYGFRSGHSTEMAALELIDRVIKDMDNNEIPLNIFLDLSKAFDTLDHRMLLYKLQHYGITGTSLKLFESYLRDRKQYVEFDGIKSEILTISTGVPQGSVLGPLLFIIYMNDIAEVSNVFKAIIYADDTTLSSTLSTCCLTKSNRYNNDYINKELDKISGWLKLNKLSLNVAKSKFMTFHTKRRQVPNLSIRIDGVDVEQVNEFNFLGIRIDSHLDWKAHASHIANKLSKTMGILNRLKHYIPMKIKLNIYNSLVLSHINYGILAWGFSLSRIVLLQKKIVRVITLNKYNAHTEPLFKALQLLKVQDIFKLQELKFHYKLANKKLPEYFMNMLNTNVDIHAHKTRIQGCFHITRVNHVYAKRCLRQSLQLTLRNTPVSIKEKLTTHSLQGFSNYVKNIYIKDYKFTCNEKKCYVCKNSPVIIPHVF